MLVSDQSGQAAARYRQLEADREPYLRRARAISALTIPTMYPPSGYSNGGNIEDPWQSIGSRGTNNLASKIQLALFPPTRKIFEFTLPETIKQALEASFRPEDMKKITDGLLSREKEIMLEMRELRIRNLVFDCAKHLIVSGNVVFTVPNKGMPRWFPLDRFVCVRDGEGNLIELIVKETLAKETLDDDVREIVERSGDQGSPTESRLGTTSVDIYTVIKRDGKYFTEYQEVNGVEIPGTDSKYKVEDPRWFALRFTRVSGDHYGRSYGEDYAGDLVSLDTAAEAINLSSIATAMTRFGVKPNSGVNIDEVMSCPNLGFFTGEEGDIWSLSTDKAMDLNASRQYINDLRQTLGFAFLLNSAAPRDAERVTAEEIRFLAQELETALGGIYSLLVDELQRPVIVRIMNRLIASRRITDPNKEIYKQTGKRVDISILTGLEAIGRSQDATQIEQALTVVTQLLGPQIVQQELDLKEIMQKIFQSFSVETSGIFKSDETKQQEQQQAQAMAIAQSGTGTALVNAAAENLTPGQ